VIFQRVLCYSYYTATVLLPFVQDYPGELVPEEIFTYLPILIMIPPCSIYALDNLFAQPLSTSCLVYLLVWSPPPHTPYISSSNQSSFCNTCPYHQNLFCCSTKIISSILSQLFTWNSVFYVVLPLSCTFFYNIAVSKYMVMQYLSFLLYQ